MKIIQSRLFVPCIITALALSLCTAPAMAALTYTGGLSGTPSDSSGGLFVSGWESASLSWTVTWVPERLMWNFSYDLTAIPKDFSHFILETTKPFKYEELSDLNLKYKDDQDGNPVWLDWSTNVEIGQFTSTDQGGSNPGMPVGDGVYGLKFELDSIPSYESITSVAFCFDTKREPVWGDFYAKDGRDGTTPAYLYNVSFNEVDPQAPASDGSLNFKVLRPDGPLPDDPGDEVTPELSSGLLLLLGALPVGIAWRRRRR